MFGHAHFYVIKVVAHSMHKTIKSNSLPKICNVVSYRSFVDFHLIIFIFNLRNFLTLFMLIYEAILLYLLLIMWNISYHLLMTILNFCGFMFSLIKVKFLNFFYTLKLWFNVNLVHILSNYKVIVVLSLKDLKLIYSKVDMSDVYLIHTLHLKMELWNS